MVAASEAARDPWGRETGGRRAREALAGSGVPDWVGQIPTSDFLIFERSSACGDACTSYRRHARIAGTPGVSASDRACRNHAWHRSLCGDDRLREKRRRSKFGSEFVPPPVRDISGGMARPAPWNGRDETACSMRKVEVGDLAKQAAELWIFRRHEPVGSAHFQLERSRSRG